LTIPIGRRYPDTYFTESDLGNTVASKGITEGTRRDSNGSHVSALAAEWTQTPRRRRLDRLDPG
jgi:hypothetical protein